MHIVSDQQGRRSKFRDPRLISYFRDPRHCKSASSSQLPADVHRRLSAGCSIFSYYGFHKKILSPPSDYNGTWSTSPFLCSGSQPIISQVFNKVWGVSTWWSWYACVWWISWPCYPFGELYCDMDILLTPGLRSTSTMWLRRFKDQFKKKRFCMNLSKN